jgi:hypothetical protein
VTQIARAICAAGALEQVARILMSSDDVAKMMDDLIPRSSIRNRLSSRMTLVSYHTLLVKCKGLFSAAGTPANGAKRRQLAVALTELVYMALSRFVSCGQRKHIMSFTTVPDFLPFPQDFELQVQTTFVAEALKAYQATVDNIPNAERAYEPALSEFTQLLYTLGASLARIAQRASFLRTAASVVKWHLLSPVIPDFPAEIETEPALTALESNLTFVRYALEHGESAVIGRVSMWPLALRETLAALKDTEHFVTVRAADLRSMCGHSHIMGPGGRLIGCLAYANLPGSSPLKAFLPAPLSRDVEIGTYIPAEALTAQLSSAVGGLVARSSSEWVGDLLPLYSMCVTHRYAEVPRIKTAKENIPLRFSVEGVSAPPGTVAVARFAMTKEMLWLYAACVQRELYLRYRVSSDAGEKGEKSSSSQIAGQQSEDKNQPITFAKADYEAQIVFRANTGSVPLPIVEETIDGVIETPDPWLVLLATPPSHGTLPMPCMSDSIPNPEHGTLLDLPTVPRLRDFATIPIKWSLTLDRAHTQVVTATNLLALLQLPQNSEVNLVLPLRARLLLQCFSTFLSKLASRTPPEKKTVLDLQLARLRGLTLMQHVTNSAVVASIAATVRAHMRAQAGAQPLADVMRTTTDQHMFNLRLRMLIGLELLSQTGLFTQTQVAEWLAALETSEWYAIIGMLETSS